jgi:hypothetical protein
MHNPYDMKLGHPADFRVRYRFYTREEGGRLSAPNQGYRSDFWYAHESQSNDEVFMILPEFENADGEVILQSEFPVPISGTARMWVLVPERRPYHYEKIKPGLIGYFMEGPNRVAECEVIELVGLFHNPTRS